MAVPRVLLTDTWCGPPGQFQPGREFVRRGTLIFADVGSPLEAYYGGSSNLGPLPAAQAASGDAAGHAMLGN